MMAQICSSLTEKIRAVISELLPLKDLFKRIFPYIIKTMIHRDNLKSGKFLSYDGTYLLYLIEMIRALVSELLPLKKFC